MRRWPWALLVLLLAGPAVVLGALAWRSLQNEEGLAEHSALLGAILQAEATARLEASRLEGVRRREDARPYFEWQARYMPEALVTGNEPAFVDNPMAQRAGDAATGTPSPDAAPEVVGWSQWTFEQGRVIGPDLLRWTEGDPGWHRVRAALGDLPEQRLRAAPQDEALRAVASRPVPVRVVAANEEVGQLLEELDVARKQAAQTEYLEGFQNRVQARALPSGEATVGVRQTPFRHVALPGAGPGDPPVLLAWRLVWVPAHDAKARRDAPADRWLLQAYAPALRLPSVPVAPAPGATAWAYAPLDPAADPAPPAAGSPSVRPLADALGAETPRGPVPRLAVVGVVGATAIAERHQAEEGRLRWVLVGLGAVVGVGLFVVGRAVRRELRLAARKQDFVAAVTHELKTPLAGIRMYAEMLGEGWVPEGASAREYAGRIVGESQRLSGLVDQVLDLAAHDRGTARARVAPGDMGAAVRSAVALAEGAAREAGVPISVEIDPSLPPARFDPDLLRPLVLNLVDNAVKYSARAPTKDVRVLVRRGGGGVEVVVADRGPGLPDEVRRHLFEPFTRGGREDTREARGVGLGLALVRRYADAMGARVRLDSEAGRGTTAVARFRVE